MCEVFLFFSSFVMVLIVFLDFVVVEFEKKKKCKEKFEKKWVWEEDDVVDGYCKYKKLKSVVDELVFEVKFEEVVLKKKEKRKKKKDKSRYVENDVEVLVLEEVEISVELVKKEKKKKKKYIEIVIEVVFINDIV